MPRPDSVATPLIHRYLRKYCHQWDSKRQSRRQKLPHQENSFSGIRQNDRMLIRTLLLAITLCVFQSLACAVAADIVVDTAERFVRQHTERLGGSVRITMGKLDTSRLPPCTTHEAYAPPGSRLSGRTHIGVRCLAPNAWSVLVPVQISVFGSFVTAGRSLAAGQVLAPEDLAIVSGDITQLPTGTITNPQQALGKALRNAVGIGQPIRSEQLAAPLLIRQGQTVRVISQGNSFVVSAEGKALNNASEGQVVQVRMNTGQTLSGLVRSDGSVEVTF